MEIAEFKALKKGTEAVDFTKHADDMLYKRKIAKDEILTKLNALKDLISIEVQDQNSNNPKYALLYEIRGFAPYKPYARAVPSAAS